jgi:allophanate hydrolase subunit 2
MIAGPDGRLDLERIPPGGAGARPAWPSEQTGRLHHNEPSEWDDRFWTNRQFRVGSQSDRMGLRLEGDPVWVVTAPERLSTPVAPGAIQVAGGQLIVLGIACGTMGGYPHIAHVISADLNRLGQLKPGDRIHFRRVTLEEARHEDQRARQARKTFLSRVAIAAKDA